MKIIEVIPNPYIALDKDGIPQGVVGAGMPGLFIGAAQDLVASQDTGKQRFYFPPNRDGSFTKKVHLSPEIIASVNAGELIAANAADAKACGITTKSFLAPEVALAAEKAKALAYWQALHGDEHGLNKSAAVGDIPRTATVRAADAVAPPTLAHAQITPTVKLTKNKES